MDAGRENLKKLLTAAEVLMAVYYFSHKRFYLILIKEKAGNPFQDFLLGNAEAAVLISAYKI